MKIARMIVAAWAVMIMATIAIASAPIASASYPIVGKLGSELTMTDTVGQVIPQLDGEQPQTQHRRNA